MCCCLDTERKARLGLARRRFTLISCLLLLFGGCEIQRAVSAHDGAGRQPGLVDSGLPLGDGPLVLPDAPQGDGPDVCNEPRGPLILYADPRGNFQLALKLGSTARPIGIAGADARTSAATVDHARVAALATTRDATPVDPAAALAAWEARLRAEPGLYLSLRTSGVAGKSADGDPDVKEASWDIATTTATDIASLRNRLLAIFLQKPTSALSGLAPANERRTGNFVLTATLSLRAGQARLAAALAARDHHDADTGTDFALIADLGNGTALGTATARLDQEGCDRGPISAQGQADILWVIDESGSMRDNREAIAQHAAAFFAKASAAGLDFRMGVTGMIEPGKDGAIAGKLCSKLSSNPYDEGGDDRFLGPGEHKTFLSCIRNPPYYEAGTEYGLAALREVIERHLPRTADEPGRIRPGAKLAVVLVTDEAPQELKLGGIYQQRYGFLEHDTYGPKQCSLSTENAQQLTDYLRPWVDLLSGASDPESAATVYLLGGTCANGCQAEIPYGYRELVQLTGGHRADVCQKDLAATLQLIVDSIVSAASPRVLAQRPISASLRVTANGLALPRSKLRGFRYSAAQNALTFHNVEITKGTQITASYSRFVP